MTGSTIYTTPYPRGKASPIGWEHSLPVMEYRLSHAISEIHNSFGDVVSIEDKKKTIQKFGQASDIDATNYETVWAFNKATNGANDETYVSDNLITTISSSNSNDDQEMKLKYHTIDGSGNFTFGVQDVTLDGQNQVTLPTPCARVSRLYNDDTSEVQGEVFVYEDDTDTSGVPDTAAKVHLYFPAGEQQSQKVATTISNNDYLLITKVFGGLAVGGGGNRMSTRIEIREKGKVFRPRRIISTNDNFIDSLDPVLIVPKNADIRMRAIASNTNRTVHCGFSGYLATVIEAAE